MPTNYFNSWHQEYCSKDCQYIGRSRQIGNNAEVLKLYANGLGLFKLGRRFGVNQNVIAALLTQNGIKIRSAAEQRKLLKQLGIGNWKKTQTKPCKICGKPFRSAVNKTYCSVRCTFNDPEFINGMRRHALEQLREGRTPHTNTKIEKEVATLLREQQIPYEPQYPLGYWSFDFFVPNNLLIEIDGDYWHGNPLFFKKLNATQIKNIQNDKRKMEYAKQKGFNIIRFWENDINKNWPEVRAKIIEEVQNAKRLL